MGFRSSEGGIASGIEGLGLRECGLGVAGRGAPKLPAHEVSLPPPRILTQKSPNPKP